MSSSWRDALALFKRPQPVTIPMVLLFSIVPFYLFIGHALEGQAVHLPVLPWDAAFALQPAWSVVYASLFLAVFLPVFVVHQQALVRRTIFAYLGIWLTSYAVFLAYPTGAPLHADVTGEDFFSWALRALYESDVRYNCFPSLHVAQCCLAALCCWCVHRGVGLVAGVWAVLVSLSTLFTKQHYVADVIAGALLAYLSYLVFLRAHPRESIPADERRLAPFLATGAFALYAIILAGLWLLYRFVS